VLPLRVPKRNMRGISRAGRFAIAYVPPPRHSGSTLRPLHGVCGATRLRCTYALTHSGGGLAPAESGPEDVAAHCSRSMACRYASCGLSMNPTLLVMRRTQRHAVRGRAGSAAP